MTFTLYKYNNGRTHQLDTHDSQDTAIQQAKTLHHPDWPNSQGISVYMFKAGHSVSNNCIFDTNN